MVQDCKRDLAGGGTVIASDCSDLAPAVYDADKFYLVPRIDEPGYIDVVLDICKN